MGDELCSVSTRHIQAKELNFHLIRPQNIVSCSRNLSCAFLQTPGMLSCAFFSGVVSNWPLSHEASICEVLQRLLASDRFSHLSQGTLCSSVRVVIGFFVVSLIKVLLSHLLRLVRRPALGRFMVVPYSFHFLMMELTMLLGTFNTLEIVLYPSPDQCLLTILSLSSTDSSLDFVGEFLL